MIAFNELKRIIKELREGIEQLWREEESLEILLDVVVNKIYEARYHKVEGKPPLLSDDQIKAIARPHIMPTWQIQRILQAQRDADMRFYEQHGKNVR